MPNWLFYALLGAFCASLTNILSKVGMKDIDATLATGIRGVVMVLFLLLVCTVKGLWAKLPTVNGLSAMMIVLSGVAGAMSWLFMFHALKFGEATQVMPIDKLSMPLGIVLAVIILAERPSLLNWAGIFLIAGGAYLAAWPRPKPTEAPKTAQVQQQEAPAASQSADPRADSGS